MEMSVLLKLRKFIVPEIIYGPGALQLAGRHTVNFGASKVLIVTDPGVIQAGWAGKVEGSLKSAGVDYCVYSDVTSNPKDSEVMNGADIYRRRGCDLILAVGGGSPMDCAKGIGVVVGNEKNILTFEGVDEIPGPGPPLIFIPTTAGSSADVSQFAIITDTHRNVKIAIVSKMVIPDIALVDPETTCTMPPELTAATGMDALCHAFEAYVSSASSLMTDMTALEAVRLIADNLVGACREPDNMVYRDLMMMASMMAGWAFSNASLGLVHAMAHSLGGRFDLAHGQCNAMLLEKVVEFNFASAAVKYMRLAGGLGVEPNDNPQQILFRLLERIAGLRHQTGITQKLSDFGIQTSDLPDLARNAAKDPCLSTNPRSATTDQIEVLYRQIF